MKFFIDLSKKQLIKSAASNVALERVVLKRRDSLAVEVVFVSRNAVATMPAGTTVSVALKKSFADSNFLASASGTPPILNLNTVPLEALFTATAPSAIPALLEIRWTVPGETTRTATLTAEVQNSVILGTEGTPEAIPDGKATQTEAQAGTNNEKWMTPLRTAQAIAVLAPPPTWAAVQDKPSTFPPSSHTHTAADLTDFAAAVQSTSIGASQLPPLSYQTTRHTGDGTTTSFQPPGTLTASDSASAISVTINGVMQEPSVDYTLNVAANRIVLDAPLPAGDKIVITRPLLLPSTTTLSAEQIGAASIPALAAETQARQTALQGKASTSHKSTHAIGGSDALTPADIAALPDAIVVSGAGTASANGTYTRGADLNGYKAWYKGTGDRIYVDGSLAANLIGWRLKLGSQPSASYSSPTVSSGLFDSNGIPYFTDVGAFGSAPVPSVRATHGHAIADISGLQTALDGKAAAGLTEGGEVQKATELYNQHSGNVGLRIYDTTVTFDGVGYEEDNLKASFRAAIGAAPTANPTFTGTTTFDGIVDITIQDGAITFAGAPGQPASQIHLANQEIIGNWAFDSSPSIPTPTDPSHAARLAEITTLQTALDGKVGLSANSYVIARPGDNLATKYGEAKVLTPQGNARSATNRASLIILPGTYSLAAELAIDTEFVDIIGLGAQTQKPAVFLSTNTINVTANDVRVSGISVGTQEFKIENNKPLQVFENCTGGNNSFGGGGSTASGTFTNCTGGANSFGFEGAASGTFTNCTGGDASFGGSGTANGIFTDCTGGDGSFGGDSGTASGTFENCTGDAFSFGGNGGTASGTFTDCTGGEGSFGGYATASGTFANCTGGNNSFGGGGNDATASGTFTDCTGGDGSFGGDSGTASGTFTNCICGTSSFGGDFEGIASGTFTNCTSGGNSFGSGIDGIFSGKLISCRLTSGSFPTPSGSGLIRLCLDGSNTIVNAG